MIDKGGKAHNVMKAMLTYEFPEKTIDLTSTTTEFIL